MQIFLPATFSINGGAKISGHVIDLTHRSIALHSAACVREDDKINVSVGPLPIITGSVVRSFKGGFAIKTEEMCLSLVAYAKTQNPGAAPPAPANTARLASPPFSVEAPFPAWGRLAASCRGQGRSERHYLSLIYADGFDPKNVGHMKLISGDMTWPARLTLARKRGVDSALVVILNSWQLKKAATQGLTLETSLHDETVCNMCIPAKALDAHLTAFQPRKLQAHLLSKRPATEDNLATMDGSRASDGVITA